MTKLADAIRARAVKGEDPDKLQKEAYVAAGLKQTTVNTKLEKQRPQQHAEDASGRHGSESPEKSPR